MTFIVKCAPVMKTWSCCCCSCNMRAANVFLGWIELIHTITSFVMNVILLSQYEEPQFDPRTNTFHFQNGLYSIFSKQLLISFTVGTVGSMILYGILLYGIHKKKPMFMVPFLVLRLVGIVILTIIIVIATIYIMVVSGAVGLFILFIGAVIFVIASFFWVVFYSYYRQLEEEKNPQTQHEITNYAYGNQQDFGKLVDQKVLYPITDKFGEQLA